MVFLWCFYDISMGFLLDSCGISIGLIFLWDHYSNSHGISLWFLRYSFAKVFLLLPKLSSLVSFIWSFQKCPISQNIWYLFKTKLKNITQTNFQGGSPWATMIHNRMVCLGGTLLCPDASWVDFFQSIPLPFPWLKFFFYFLNFPH